MFPVNDVTSNSFILYRLIVRIQLAHSMCFLAFVVISYGSQIFVESYTSVFARPYDTWEKEVPMFDPWSSPLYIRQMTNLWNLHLEVQHQQHRKALPCLAKVALTAFDEKSIRGTNLKYETHVKIRLRVPSSYPFVRFSILLIYDTLLDKTDIYRHHSSTAPCRQSIKCR